MELPNPRPNCNLETTQKNTYLHSKTKKSTTYIKDKQTGKKYNT